MLRKEIEKVGGLTQQLVTTRDALETTKGSLEELQIDRERLEEQLLQAEKEYQRIRDEKEKLSRELEKILENDKEAKNWGNTPIPDSIRDFLLPKDSDNN